MANTSCVQKPGLHSAEMTMDMAEFIARVFDPPVGPSQRQHAARLSGERVRAERRHRPRQRQHFRVVSSQLPLPLCLMFEHNCVHLTGSLRSYFDDGWTDTPSKVPTWAPPTYRQCNMWKTGGATEEDYFCVE